jgi:hypothetical protein
MIETEILTLRTIDAASPDNTKEKPGHES